jgi:formiminotetrahydrofolate cyclodeaminase
MVFSVPSRVIGQSFMLGRCLQKWGIIEAMSSLHIRSLGEASESIWTLDASQVRDRTASLSPTPGGGSVSIFTATLGLALVHKGASISLKRVGDDSDRRDALSQLCDRLLSAIASMSGLADDDSQAFQAYIEARSLPRTTEGEKISRNEAMEVAILRATRVPLGAARMIYEALGHAESALKLSEAHLLCDIFAGAILMQAASKAVLLNVGANVSQLANEEKRAVLKAERAEVEKLLVERSESVEGAYQARAADSEDVVTG